jgi:hypothetical protein
VIAIMLHLLSSLKWSNETELRQRAYRLMIGPAPAAGEHRMRQFCARHLNLKGPVNWKIAPEPAWILRLRRQLAQEFGEGLAQVVADWGNGPAMDNFVLTIRLPTVLRCTHYRRRTTNRGIDSQLSLRIERLLSLEFSIIAHRALTGHVSAKSASQNSPPLAAKHSRVA